MTQKFKGLIKKLVDTNVQTSDGKTLLHVALDHHTLVSVGDFHSKFPCAAVVDVLLECGAEINALYSEKAVFNLRPTAGTATEVPEMNKILEILLRRNVYFGTVNNVIP